MPLYLRKSCAFPVDEIMTLRLCRRLHHAGSKSGGEVAGNRQDVPMKHSFTANRRAQPDSPLVSEYFYKLNLVFNLL